MRTLLILTVAAGLVCLAACDSGVCSQCKGKGELNCTFCQDGKTECRNCSGRGQQQMEAGKCPFCKGTGKTTCEICKGKGTHPCDRCGGKK